MSYDPTPTQALLLFGLLARHGACAQAELMPKVKKVDREALVREKLITSSKVGRGLMLVLADAGWAWTATHLSAALPGDGDVEVLGHLVAIDDLADGDTDGIATAQRSFGRDARGPGSGELLLGGGQQLLALARPLVGQQRIAADDEPLARIIGRGDLRHVAVVEQRELQLAGVDELADRRCPQRGDPVEPGRLEISRRCAPA